jgi:hypothetical protein
MTPLGWDTQTGPIHPFDYGTSAILPRIPPASYDELGTVLSQNTNPYGQAIANQPYQSFQTEQALFIDHPPSLRGESYPSGHKETEHSLSSKAADGRNFVPAPASRQRSFSSDDWQKLSPPSASAPNGTIFTFEETFNPEGDLAAKQVKQEVIFPGKKTMSSTS